MNVMMQLRKCCNHPYLLQSVEETELQGIVDPQQIHSLLVQASGKLVLIDKLLPRLREVWAMLLLVSTDFSLMDSI